MVPSTYQKVIFNFITNGIGNAIVNAVAGSGKTTTLIESLKLTVGRVLFLAFNKSIATELQKRAPKNVECSTLHSAGFSLLRSFLGRVKVDNYKVDNIMDGYIPLMRKPSIKGAEATALYADRGVVKKMVSYVKAGLIDYNDADAMAELSNYYGVDDYAERHLPMIQYVIEKNNESKHSIDFDDMIYLPVVLKMKSKVTYDWIFVDESQDLNRSQIELVLSLTSGTGRVVCVGDPKQSIYGFRGADCGAMDRIKTALNATEFPLSVCYRCPTSVLDIARNIVPAIEARENAEKGEVVTIKVDSFVDTLTAEKAEDTLVLCRTNSELVGYALRLISKGFKAVIKGRDIGKGLISLVKKFRCHSVEELELNLSSWKSKEISKLSKRQNADNAIQLVNDKYDCIMAVIDGCDTVYCVTNKLESLFSDNNLSGYIFSSVHKAKGLEADNVYILSPNKMPLVWKNQQAWEAEQEMNIKYVAVTRALKKLIWVGGK